MGYYVKKPVIVEAFRFTNEDRDRVFYWVTCTRFPGYENGKPVLIIRTLEGDMIAHLGDWIIKGVKGEFYPCKDDIFQETYSELDKMEYPERDDLPN